MFRQCFRLPGEPPVGLKTPYSKVHISLSHGLMLDLRIWGVYLWASRTVSHTAWRHGLCVFDWYTRTAWQNVSWSLPPRTKQVYRVHLLEKHSGDDWNQQQRCLHIVPCQHKRSLSSPVYLRYKRPRVMCAGFIAGTGHLDCLLPCMAPQSILWIGRRPVR